MIWDFYNFEVESYESLSTLKLLLTVQTKTMNPINPLPRCSLFSSITDTQTSKHHQAEQRWTDHPPPDPETHQPWSAFLWDPRPQTTTHHQRGAAEWGGVGQKFCINQKPAAFTSLALTPIHSSLPSQSNIGDPPTNASPAPPLTSPLLIGSRGQRRRGWGRNSVKRRRR